MTPAASLYVGKTTHARLRPRPHRFSYGLFQLLIDVDRIDEAACGTAPAASRPLRRCSRSPSATTAPATDSLLRTWVEARLAEAGSGGQRRRIRLLCFPAHAGLRVQPDLDLLRRGCATARLEAVIYEVNNTFGQTHAYVAPAAGARLRAAGGRQARSMSRPSTASRAAIGSASPRPAETFNLVIAKSIDGAPDFIATLSAERRR